MRGSAQAVAMVPPSRPSLDSSVERLDPSAEGTFPSAGTLRVPLRLLRFHQAMAEHGVPDRPQAIGEATPPGLKRFRSTSE
jgi:hypothetical protein